MGIDLSVLDFLLKFKGRLNGTLLQLGRQGFHVSTDPARGHTEIAEIVIRRYDETTQLSDIAGENSFADTFFRFLGSDKIVAMDASNYEGADIVHDLNTPVSSEFYEQFDTIFDGGTLEHVFNLPTAFENAKKMLKTGGLYLSVNPANNLLGHGFYQFGPELMWRVFSEEAGFRVKLMQIVDVVGVPMPIDVADPESAGARLEIGRTEGPTYLLLAAEKLQSGSGQITPQQSDYRSAWSSSEETTDGVIKDRHSSG